MNLNSVPRYRPADDNTDDRTPQPGTPVDTGDLAAAFYDRAARRRLGAWLNVQIAHDTLLRRPNWPLGAAALALVTVTALTLWLTGVFLTAVGRGLTAGTRTGGLHTGTWLHDGGPARTITEPIMTWLTAHTGGLPATSTDLGLTWLAVAAVLYLAALTRSTFARIAWALTGAAATTVTYAGSTAPAAAATTAALWLLLSLPVYRRRAARKHVPADATR